MIIITCHNDNIPERTYAIDILFQTLLEISKDDYKIVFDDTTESYIVQIDNRQIIIEDHFFIHFPEPLSYLDKINIPTDLLFFHALDKVIPIIYGEDKFVKDENTIIIGLDVFASIFFMLARWEESLLGREEKGDCDEALLFSVRHNIYMRPIVHEYEELLRLLLSDCGIHLKERKYKVVMSHDVDGFLPPSYGDIAKSILREFRYGPPKNKILNLTWKEKVKYKKAFPKPFCQFTMYTELCKKYNITEWFYFKVCKSGEKECTYNYDAKETREIVKCLKEKNEPKMVLGYHPSQSTLRNEGQWEKECERINTILGNVPEIGRNHHLLYNYEMFRMWEKVAENTLGGSLEISNCVFHNKLGFRSGIAFPYFLFDIYKRRQLNLREHPCQIMDTVIRYHRKEKTVEDIWKEITPVVESAKRYGCELVLTWHIYIRNKKLILDYYKWCEKVVQYAKQQ